MNCPGCVAACKAEGGICNPLTAADLLDPELGRIAAEAQAGHRLAHLMPLGGGFHRCPVGEHGLIEAHPADAMRAAGMKPML